MRRLILWNLVTLDGFFEGPERWDIGWHELVWGDELERFSLEQTASADTLVFGRVTYQGMAAYWSTATGEIADYMNAVRKVVFSRTLDRADWNNTTLATGPAEDAARRGEADDVGLRHPSLRARGGLLTARSRGCTTPTTNRRTER